MPTGGAKLLPPLCFIVLKSVISFYYLFCLLYMSSCFSAHADAYSNIERSYIGNNFELEVLLVSIWHCVQTPYNWKGHIACGTLHIT